MKLIKWGKVCLLSVIVALGINVCNAERIYVTVGPTYSKWRCVPGHWHHGYWVPRHCYKYYYKHPYRHHYWKHHWRNY